MIQTRRRKEVLNTTQADYPAPITGSIALISRGTCTFSEKSGLAGKMGAVAAIIFNNAPGDIGGMTLAENGTSIFGPLVPTVGISGTEGKALADSIKAGSVVTATLNVKTVIADVIT